ncbi:hypothetical protein X474_26890 [Dethiosulfatarculus sandiegensis]|uniref:Uncharacterized protein n=1 Tax=Dethiosulfatarculus sandiegensis TaxID=1429043 RepID=A0A0D2JNC9_9BACT|nr:hypothetical protein X474_26890 [Dethiosulfatarculus sandiegensis]
MKNKQGLKDPACFIYGLCQSPGGLWQQAIEAPPRERPVGREN